MESSAWLKGVKILSIPFGDMPMPVSFTATARSVSSPERRAHPKESVTSPLSVNLIPLPTRLKSTCFRRIG